MYSYNCALWSLVWYHLWLFLLGDYNLNQSKIVHFTGPVWCWWVDHTERAGIQTGQRGFDRESCYFWTCPGWRIIGNICISICFFSWSFYGCCDYITVLQWFNYKKYFNVMLTCWQFKENITAQLIISMQTLPDLCKSYIPETLAQVRIYANQNCLEQYSTLVDFLAKPETIWV